MSVRDVFGTDLALLHTPSVYDFRTSVIMHGPIADAVPSTNEFEMYPVGLTSIASYLSANHYNLAPPVKVTGPDRPSVPQQWCLLGHDDASSWRSGADRAARISRPTG